MVAMRAKKGDVYDDFRFCRSWSLLIGNGLTRRSFKKPFLFSSKSNFWLVALAFSPSIIQPLYSFWELFSSSLEQTEEFEWSLALLLLIPLLIFPVVLAFSGGKCVAIRFWG